MLKSKNKSQPGNFPVKTAALTALARLRKNVEAVAKVSVHQVMCSDCSYLNVHGVASPPVLSWDKSLPSPEESLVLGRGEFCEADTAREIDPGCKKYVTSGFVSLAINKCLLRF